MIEPSTEVLRQAERMDDARERHVLLIAAHGSSTDQAVIDRVTAHAARISRKVPQAEVRVGFVRGSPALLEAVRDIGDRTQLSTLTVVPFMTSVGHYAEHVMPGVLRNALGPNVQLRITPPIGTSKRIASILQRRALRLLAQNDWLMRDTAIVVVGHGTPRHPASRDTTIANARRLARAGWQSAHAAFIDDEPGIAEVVNSISCSRVIVLPFLIGGAMHAVVDVPAALGLAPSGDDDTRYGVTGGRELLLDSPIGVDVALSEIAADFAARSYRLLTQNPAAKQGRDQSTADARGLRTGTVYLVGAGPGAADLLTIRARRLLRKADVVIHDRLISDDVLALARTEARLVDVGKWPDTPQDVQTSINQQLVAAAHDGHMVVRLKGGDPFVFGRGSEEIEACRAAGVRVVIVPGVSSALAAPAVAGIPVTARGISRGFAVVTAATASDNDGSALHVSDYAKIDTLVVLMGRARLSAVCGALIAQGRAPTTPVACIERATLPGERVVRGTLATIAQLAEEADLTAPMVTVIGPTAHHTPG